MKLNFVPFLRWFRAYRALEKENRLLREWRSRWERFVPLGHFYSPLPSDEDIEDAFRRDDFGPPFPGIDLNEEQQFARIRRFASWYPELPFVEQPTPGRRFFLQNDSYGHEDAVMLYGMLREARPRRIIEVGSGLSSAAMLDLDEALFGRTVEFTFVDPDFKRLRPLLREDDLPRVRLLEQKVQEVPLSIF
ncbi:MAG TPA: hypothetical protein VEQ65_00850, partial [Opitutus sp.]|nr:hypothetical protein [Opitutus sp.]